MAYRSEFYLGDRNPHVDETEVSWMDPFKETFDDSVTKGVYDLGMRGLESLGDKYAQDYAGAKSLLGAVGSSVSDAAKTFGGFVADEAKELGDWRGWVDAGKEATRPIWTTADTLLGMGAGMTTMATAGIAGSGAALATRDISNFGPVVDKVLNEMPTYHPHSEGGQEILKGLSDVVFSVAIGAGEGVQWAADKSGAPPRIAQTAGAITSALVTAATVGVPMLRVRGTQVPTPMRNQWSLEAFAAGRKDVTATINNPVFIARMWNYLDAESYALAVKNNTLWTDIPMIQEALIKNFKDVAHKIGKDNPEAFATAGRGGDLAKRPWVQHIIENIKNLETSLNRPYQEPTATITTYKKALEDTPRRVDAMGHEWAHVLDYFLYDLLAKESKTSAEAVGMVPDFRGNVRPIKDALRGGFNTASMRTPSVVEFAYEASTAPANAVIKFVRKDKGKDYVPEGMTLESWRNSLMDENLGLSSPTEVLARLTTLQRYLKENPDISLNDLFYHYKILKQDRAIRRGPRTGDKIDVRGRSQFTLRDSIPSDINQLFDMMQDMKLHNKISSSRIVEMVEAMLDDVRMTYPKKYNVEFYLGDK